MFYKGLTFAAAAILASVSALTAASAGPAFNGFALQRNGVSITKIDYYYPGYDDGEAPYSGGGLADVPGYGRDPADAPGYWRGPADAPGYGRGLADGDVIGGALGVITGAIGGALHGSGTYARPYDRPGYDDAPYYRGYSGAYEESPVEACQRNFPYFDPRTGTYLAENGEEFVCPYLER